MGRDGVVRRVVYLSTCPTQSVGQGDSRGDDRGEGMRKGPVRWSV